MPKLKRITLYVAGIRVAACAGRRMFRHLD